MSSFSHYQVIRMYFCCAAPKPKNLRGPSCEGHNQTHTHTHTHTHTDTHTHTHTHNIRQLGDYAVREHSPCDVFSHCKSLCSERTHHRGNVLCVCVSVC